MSESQPSAPPRFEAVNRAQIVLETVDVEQLISADHPARNIWDFLGKVDLSRFQAKIKAVEGHPGRDAWEPRLLIAMWLYAYSRGISSAREIQRQCSYEPALRWLTGLRNVNHHTLSDFRVRHGEALQNLFVQVLGVLTVNRLVTLERVTVDGTKVRACVNKKTFSKQSKIRAHLEVARKHVESLQQEEAQQEQRGRQAAKRRAARERVERLEEALAEVKRLEQDKKNEKSKPCQASITDPDAQFMRNGDHGLIPAYNVQLTTDCENKLFVNVSVSKQPSDAFHLEPAMEKFKQITGVYPKQVLGDGDYTNRAAVIGMAERGIDFYGSWMKAGDKATAYGIHPEYHPAVFQYDAESNQMICPEGKRLSLTATQSLEGEAVRYVFAARREDCLACPRRMLCTPKSAMAKHGRAVTVQIEDARVEAFKEKMQTEEAKAIYRLRSPVAEFPHAWLKAKLNWVRVRCRGLLKVQCEAYWACLAHNLQRYFRLRSEPAAA